MEVYVLSFIPIFFAVDALGMIPVFHSLTRRMPEKERQDLVRRSTLVALIVAVLFLFAGSQIFRWIGITMQDFFIAGGAILFVIAVRDILLSFGKGSNLPDDSSIGIVPLAVPLMVGPAVLTTSAVIATAFGVVPTLVSLVVNLLLCGVALHFSGALSKVLGEAGSNTISKIANLLLAAIGIMLIRRGIAETVFLLAQSKPPVPGG